MKLFNDKKEARELIFFGDKHDDEAPAQILINMLPYLKDNKIDTLFVELRDGVSMNDIIKELEFQVRLVELFPEGIPNSEQLTKEQILFFQKYSMVTKEIINTIVKDEKAMLSGHKKMIELIKTAQKYSINVVGVDVQSGKEYINRPYGLKERNEYMLRIIEKTKFKKGILCLGLLHFINTWLKPGYYNRSIIELFLTKTDIKIHQPIFYITSSGEGEKKLQTYLTNSDENTKNFFKYMKFDEEKNKEILKTIWNQVKNNQFISKKVSSNPVEYFCFLPNKRTVKDKIEYLEDLGAVNIEQKNDSLIKFKLHSSDLKKNIREVLVLDRVKAVSLTEEGIEYLKNNVAGLCVEINDDDNQMPLLLTFADDSKLKRKITHRDHIKYACENYKLLSLANTCN
jgi:hypothetical protein